MALYLIGDVQGCNAALGHLLDKLAFCASRDQLILLGDLVNRGPDSLGVLRRVMALGAAAQGLLGNHDLHLLALACGVRRAHRHDTLTAILEAPDRAALLDWMRQRPLALRERGVLMVHAGVLPQWTAARAMALAGEVKAVLRGGDWGDFMRQMYGNEPAAWRDDLRGADRLRVIVNALTRLRFCTPEGRMEFATKVGGAAAAPPGHLPWFDVPQRKTASDVVAFGHWSTLGRLERDDVIALDSGCVWGGALTAVRLDADARQRERICVPCPPAQRPGAT